jgi:hypothetical protein
MTPASQRDRFIEKKQSAKNLVLLVLGIGNNSIIYPLIQITTLKGLSHQFEMG